ncbi:TetR/AcrR family transcriptional regulator [Mycobacterium paragordonae]|uniref:TetR/AcrR family transcriptional regulator n=1 Tax=Mycobacterium paragordonae TaxID=1389713 RepID=UPI0013C4EF6E|nr:TetR/AcrR family transcriptional regulator [Mycobacterium paragordonae]
MDIGFRLPHPSQACSFRGDSAGKPSINTSNQFSRFRPKINFIDLLSKDMGELCDRDRVFNAVFSLSERVGYEAVSMDAIAAAADVSPEQLTRFFSTKDAAVVAIAKDVLADIADSLARVESASSPETALLLATAQAIEAVIDGRGVITRDQMLAMARIVAESAPLQREVSKARKEILTPALAIKMGVSITDARVRRAVTRWSVIATGSYLSRISNQARYELGHDQSMSERMFEELVGTFRQVMGDDA